MKWVTWENVGVDRIGCAWLIRKRIDSKAKFLFIPVGKTALPEGVEPFDIPGVRLSHHQGHCSFYAILREYKFDDPVLARMARIIDEADTVQEVQVEPAAPGLDLIARASANQSGRRHDIGRAIVADALCAAGAEIRKIAVH
jgi:hypothetical protein